MRAGFKTRVERLEGKDEQGRLMAHIVYLRPDGQPEHPADFEVEGPIVCLPRKAPSAGLTGVVEQAIDAGIPVFVGPGGLA